VVYVDGYDDFHNDTLPLFQVLSSGLLPTLGDDNEVVANFFCQFDVDMGGLFKSGVEAEHLWLIGPTVLKCPADLFGALGFDCGFEAVLDCLGEGKARLVVAGTCGCFDIEASHW
jgi:hypothetical protein